MVVVSGSWAKYAVKYPTPAANNDMVISGEAPTMAAKAVLICRQNSHHFNERTLTLDQPVKIGRSVARAKAASNNAIFDCKVLSRHHALLWYKDGKFYLQDTKSSNGTFVNNIRLTAESENHEVSSGDIVQFGVNVVENNRQVTHGCIVATLRLYLPDGKEAKASPTITEGDRLGSVPLDDLYKLNQVIQEAKQREQCLEMKLAAMQQIVDETKKSADKSWQAYVGEERLLSRVSTLESQLQQASKNFGEDRIREELAKVQKLNESYQVSAKETLEKLHAQRLEAMASATEQERARISAEQETLLVRQQLTQSQFELEEVAQILTEQQKKAEEERQMMQKRIDELENKLAETERMHDLLKETNALMDGEENNKSSLIYNDLKMKEDLLLAENEEGKTDKRSNGIQNHITLSVRPVEDESQKEKADQQNEQHETPETDVETLEVKHKHVHFNLPEDTTVEGESGGDTTDEESLVGDTQTISDTSEKGDYVDSHTLKYQFQSAQNELKRKIEVLEALSNVNKIKLTELTNELSEEKEKSMNRLRENESLKEELSQFEQKWKESCNESQQLRDKVESLSAKLEEKSDSNERLVTFQQLVDVEEELVLLKERFAKIGDEKLKLQHELYSLTEQYKVVCNRSYNKHFFYIAPLVIMVLYLLISAMIS
ncbi:sarcolemmal membrane-associated protein [Aethina tumida]|uniref:sarcolemmal membrane-associated protein n=1 Tax=Aethina tumida TaxID=116153 RepID=UPI00096B35FA|nr:sarcolemmal membrane-associated protein [Aethina tumida]